MFDHTHQLDRIERQLAQLLINQATIMANVQEVQAAQATETQAIADLETRISNLPASVATASDLDGFVATAQANTAAINGLDPAPPAAQ